jgi:hypothetical protein
MNIQIGLLRIWLLSAAVLLVACGTDETSLPPEPDVTLVPSPAADGSFAPRLSSGPDGMTVLSWLEPAGKSTHALKFAVMTPTGWGPAATVTSGRDWFANWADFPSVVPVSATLWGAHWLVRRDAGGYAYDIYAVVSTDGGQSWSEPFNPHTDDTDTEHGFVSMFASAGNIGMVWLDGRKFVNEVTDNVADTGMTLRAALFGADGHASSESLVDDLICDCCQTDVTVTDEGPVAIYRNRTAGEIRDIYVARQVDGEWQPAFAVSNDHWEIPGCPVNGPVIESQGATVAAAWFSAPADRPRIKAAWSQDAGKTFGEAILVSDDRPLGHVGSAMLPDGDLVVSWQRRTGSGGAELCLRRVSADGQLGDVRVVSEAAGMFAISVPQLAQDGGDLLLAWTIEADDVYGIRTARVPAGFLK